MSLVENDVVPGKILKCGYDVESVVGGNTNVKLTTFHLIIKDVLSKLLFRIEVDDSEVGCPTLKLFHPV